MTTSPERPPTSVRGSTAGGSKTTPSAPAPTRAASRRTPRSVVVSAWAVPLLVLGQFALLAAVPVALVLVGSIRDARLRALRWPAGLLAASYTTPLVIWLVRPDGAQSLSRDIHPVFVTAIVAVSAVVLVTIHARRR